MKNLSIAIQLSNNINTEWASFRPIRVFVFLGILIIAQSSLSHEINAEDAALTPAIVLDFELLGDTSISSLKTRDAQLLTTFSKQFRQLLKQQKVFNVIDDKQSLALLAREAERQFLHRCNGCELDLARKLGAKIVVVPWVYRISAMVQVMNIEIRDVETGRLIMKRPYDFRGNNEKAWDRTMRYAFKDIKRAAARL